VKLKRFLYIIFIIILAQSAIAESRGVLERPLMIGPQYPLIFMSTAFEPDSAFLLPEGEMFFQTSYSITNTWGHSDNAIRDENGINFSETDSDGYSLYFDGEIERRFLKFHYGFNDSIEFQYIYREIRLTPGSLDGLVENFHESINVGNAGRESTARDQLEIYIYDNKNNRIVTKLTQPTNDFHQESMQLGLKFLVRETANEAISISLTSNFSDHYIERGMNEATSDAQSEKHVEFNDFMATIRYTSIFPLWTLHVGSSIAFVSDTLLDNSPEELYYFFAASNWHITENWDLLFQVLEYSSPFPNDNRSSLSEDIREITMGLRWLIGSQFALESGFVENQSQGPQNIDIMFFFNTMFNF
jgi:hypothetical protein